MNIYVKRLYAVFKISTRVNPALEVVICLLLAICVILKVWSGLILGLFLPLIISNKRLLSFYLPVFIILSLFLHFHHGNIGDFEQAKGLAKIKISQVKEGSSHYGPSTTYSGVVLSFKSNEGKKIYNVPFKMFLPKKMDPLDASKHYFVEVILNKGDSYGYSLKIKKDTYLKKVSRSYSLAQMRYELKNKLQSFVQRDCSYNQGAEFLASMATGDFKDHFLIFTFSRLGLSHLLAISGLHFALLILFVGLIISPFSSHKVKMLLLLISATLFYLFIGVGPSLERAWVVLVLYLIGSFFQKYTSPLNMLFLAAIFILLLDPFMITHLGFQFSFLITFAILTYYRPMFNFLSRYLMAPTKIEKVILKALSLGLAVHIAAIIISLFHFHKFYLMSFVYNLIFPAVFSALILVMLLGLSFSIFLPYVAKYILKIDSLLTEKVLSIIFWIPYNLDYCLKVPYFPKSLAISVVSVFVIFGIFINYKGLIENEYEQIYLDS